MSKKPPPPLPPHLDIFLRHNPKVRAVIAKDATVVVLSEPSFAHDVFDNIFDNIFEATVFNGVNADPWSAWASSDAKWTPYEYINAIEAKQREIPNRDNKTTTKKTDGDDSGDNSDIISTLNEAFNSGDPSGDSKESLFQIGFDDWNSKLISDWICADRNIGQRLVLREITHFRRYNNGKCFEFLCHWAAGTDKVVATWQKYVDIVRIKEFKKVLDKYGWNVNVEKERNWELSKKVATAEEKNNVPQPSQPSDDYAYDSPTDDFSDDDVYKETDENYDDCVPPEFREEKKEEGDAATTDWDDCKKQSVYECVEYSDDDTVATPKKRKILKETSQTKLPPYLLKKMKSV